MATDELTRRTRVAIVQEYVPKYRAAFFRALRGALSDRGMDLTVAGGAPGPRGQSRGDIDETQHDARVRQRELIVGDHRLTLRRLPAEVRDADIVVFEQARRNLDVYARLLKPRRRQLLALWGHGIDYSLDSGNARRAVLAWMTKRSDHCFVYTEAGRRAVSALGIDDSRITVVRNTTDTAALRRARDAMTDVQVAGWARDLQLGGGPVFSFIGALDRAKGVDLLLQAWDIQLRHDPTSSLLVGGDGADRSLFLDAEGKPKPGIRLLGYVDDALKAQMAAVSQCLIVPGQVGLVAVDAMVLGLPLITVSTANHGPEFDYLEPEVGVFACSPTAQAVAATMKRVVSLKEQGAPAIEVDDGMTVEAMAERFATGLKKLAERGRPR